VVGKRPLNIIRPHRLALRDAHAIGELVLKVPQDGTAAHLLRLIGEWSDVQPQQFCIIAVSDSVEVLTTLNVQPVRRRIKQQDRDGQQVAAGPFKLHDNELGSVLHGQPHDFWRDKPRRILTKNVVTVSY
jgi:hypothetical protein